MQKIYNRTCKLELEAKHDKKKCVEISICVNSNHSNLMFDSILDSLVNISSSLQEYKEKPSK